LLRCGSGPAAGLPGSRRLAGPGGCRGQQRRYALFCTTKPAALREKIRYFASNIGCYCA